MDKFSQIIQNSREKHCVPFYCMLLLSLVALICSMVVAFSKPDVKDANDKKLRDIKNANGVILLMVVVIMAFSLFKVVTLKSE